MKGNRQVPPEVHSHLHCFEHVQLQAVMTRQPNVQPPGCRLICIMNKVSNCGVICAFHLDANGGGAQRAGSFYNEEQTKQISIWIFIKVLNLFKSCMVWFGVRFDDL